ncbi:shufflon system plasmid conjugative transfer pilus tip adhesin PilV [Escherichia sp. E1130]|nr:shufflon system plasmid conjugative transfer pilus tip adhesin PilV [Escherichia sp. E1130]
MAIVLTIVLIAAPVGMQRYASYLEEQDWTVTATHLSTANQAARQYIKDNYDTLLTQVKNGGNVTVTGQSLRDKGYLPAGFSLANNSTQNYILAITRNPSQTDKLVAFVLTAGGQELAFKAQRYIAQNTSGLGGYIYPANIANGASGGWQLNLASMGLSGQTGHLVTYLTSDVLAGGAEESDRLYRFAVNGRPDLNRMHTAIDMNTNNIDNAGTISATTSRISGESYTGGSFRTTGDGGWYSEKHQGGFFMSDDDWIRTFNNKNIYTSGQIKGGTLRSDGRLSAGDVIGLDKINIAGYSCPINGDISRDAHGGILSCQDGIWAGSDTFPVGSPIPWPSNSIPNGYLLCNGQAFDRARNPKLAQAYPSGVLPDLRGVFLRGLDAGRGFDPGRAILSYQVDQSNIGPYTGGKLEGHHSGIQHYVPYSDREVRPKNIAFNYIVKAG